MDVNEPPAIFGYSWNNSMMQISMCLSRSCPGETTLIEHTPIGAPVGTVLATDPDAYTHLSYAIVGGNDRGAFDIDPNTGLISVAADLAAATQDLYSLAIAISDQTPPSPLVTTSSVLVHLELPYTRGLVHCATYANLPGTQVADLTNAPYLPF
jgi:hypothetical protein